MTTRTSPPSDQPNNQDVFIWALSLLGGADLNVDVEAVYLKAFELAPARLGWRTRPDLPDYKKAAKALQSVEAKTHTGLVLKVSPLTRKLTVDGIAWVEKHQDALVRLYSGGHVAPPKTGIYETLRQRLRKSVAFQNLMDEKPINIGEVAQALGCSPASSSAVWAKRLDELERAAAVLNDEDLKIANRKFSDLLAELER